MNMGTELANKINWTNQNIKLCDNWIERATFDQFYYCSLLQRERVAASSSSLSSFLGIHVELKEVLSYRYYCVFIVHNFDGNS